MITHTVVFSLNHAAGSAQEQAFLRDATVLASIPGVKAFTQLRQISPKTDFAFGFSMEFADRAAYAAYNSHPHHVAFVQERWLPEVARFMEIDYAPL